MIDIDEAVAVDAPADVVWDVLCDLPTVVSCVPGARLVAETDDGFDATITVAFGPMRVAFKGHGTLELDSATRRGALTGRGRDGRGATKAQASGEFRVEPAGPHSSSIVVVGSVTLSGALVGVIERGASVVVGNLSREFASALAERCTESSPARAETEAAAKPPARLSFARGRRKEAGA